MTRRDILRAFGVASAVVVDAQNPDAKEVDIDEEFDATKGPSVEGPRPFWQYGLDIRPGSLYGSVEILDYEMGPTYEFFHDHMRPLADTNMYSPGYLEAPEMFLIRSIGFVFSPSSEIATRNWIVKNYAGRLRLGKRLVWTSPLAMSFGIGNPFDTPDSAFVDVVSDGGEPFIIRDEIQFSGKIEGLPLPRGGDVKIWMVLKGVRARGTQ